MIILHRVTILNVFIQHGKQPVRNSVEGFTL